MPSKELTDHQLPDILPVKLTALLMDECHCDPTLDTLWDKNENPS